MSPALNVTYNFAVSIVEQWLMSGILNYQNLTRDIGRPTVLKTGPLASQMRCNRDAGQSDQKADGW